MPSNPATGCWWLTMCWRREEPRRPPFAFCGASARKWLGWPIFIELGFLNGRSALEDVELHSLVNYDGG